MWIIVVMLLENTESLHGQLCLTLFLFGLQSRDFWTFRAFSYVHVKNLRFHFEKSVKQSIMIELKLNKRRENAKEVNEKFHKTKGIRLHHGDSVIVDGVEKVFRQYAGDKPIFISLEAFKRWKEKTSK